MAEDQLEVLFHEVEALRPQVDQARLRDAATAAQTNHDTGIPEARARAEAWLTCLAQAATLSQAVVEAFAGQVDPLTVLRSPDGHQALAVEDGRTYALQLFSAFYQNDARATAVFNFLLDAPLTLGHGKQALAECPRLKPFSQTAIAQYLQQHQTEGSTNGSHP